MNITVLQRSVFQQVLADLRVKYAGYRICRVEETWTDSDKNALIEQGVWHGYYERLSVNWEIELSKLSGDYKGPNSFTISISPVFDIVFADIYPNVFYIEVSFHGFPDRPMRPTFYQIDGIEGRIWDIHYYYDAALRDL